VSVVQTMSDSRANSRQPADECSDSDESDTENFDNDESVWGQRPSQLSSASLVKSASDAAGRSTGILVYKYLWSCIIIFLD
jgi:hypothetical protein